MQAVAFHALRTAQRRTNLRSSRTIAGVRYPHPHRTFHSSPISFRSPEDPAISENDRGENQELGSGEGGDAENVGATAASEKSKAKVETLTLSKQRARNGRSQGAGRVRPNRPRQPEGLPPVLLPDWFWERNVKCVGDKEQSGSLAVFGTGTGAVNLDSIYMLRTSDNSGSESVSEGAVPKFETEAHKEDMNRQIESIVQADLTSTKDAKYSIHVDVYQEILATLRAGLALRPPKSATSQSLPRPITLLQCPKDGGTYYLDSVVETIATKLGADLVRLDAQDIAQIVGPYVDGNLAWQYTRIALLGYDSQKVAGKLEEYDKDTTPGQQDTEGTEEEEEDSVGRNLKGPLSLSLNPSDISKRLASMLGNMKNAPSKSSAGSPFGAPRMQVFDLRPDTTSQPPAALSSEADQWSALKLMNILDNLIASADSKRSSSVEIATSDSVESMPRDIIIQVRDYKEMSASPEGRELLSKIRSSINKKWQGGRNIICVGTTSSEEGESALTRPEIQHLQADVIEGEKRTIFVPPDRREEQDNVFESDEKARIRNMNIRHVEEMIKKMADGTPAFSISVDIEKDLDSAAVYAVGLEDAVWTYARTHRLATTILGLSPSLTTIDGPTFGKALKVLASSDEVKFAWGAAELKQEDVEVENMIDDMAKSGASAKKQMSDNIKQIRKNCNAHEKKLLGGVVVPADIKTTFADIRAPKETIEALKTLTSLSLIRPEAFSYGVLATDKIPGLLLYGPPGTGKTLLAKAVAKESGATVLEVSGADVNDMFVGEGEKNVKAVFSLAKKLSPCIVFIDEADAIFAARGEMKQRSSHRELINQFLREWDGMNDMSAFMMIATNRPFDLDEAVLRRLPRRLLVDLPVEKDREAILRIHLKDEMLDESVSLAKIAKDTPFYSGSDLKNLSVAAALACIREENTAAAKFTGEEAYVYPEKRILTEAHFDKALEEISASISEDMSTLTAIRKFDEKYGDRKGRRKKGAALGFGGTQVVERDSEAARVRKLEV